MFRIQTAKSFAKPSENCKKLLASEFIANNADVRGKYLWSLQGGLLGVILDAKMENNNTYRINFASMSDVNSNLFINSNYCLIGA